MKKCASCTKDLPEAALHCVFCGAKQPPAPAVQPGLAKTAFGYSNEMMQQLRQPPVTAQSPAPPMPVRPSPSALPVPPVRQTPPPPPRQSAPSQPPPIAAANAATLFIDNGVPQVPAHAAQQHQPAFAQTLAAPNAALQPTLAAPPGAFPQPLRSNAPSQPPPLGPMLRPSQPPPIFGMPANGYPAPMPAPSQNYPRQVIGGIVEPWRESIKLVMIVWGFLVIAALATPLNMDPLAFSWEALIHGEGTARIPFLVEAALGVLGIVVALLPMPVIARGALAALLGLGVIATPIALSGAVPEWHQLVVLASVLLIVPGLLMRAGYPDAVLPRVIITACVIGFIVPELVPQNGHIPLIDTIKAVMDAPGKAKIEHALHLARIVLVVLTLLVWMPAPTTAGGTMFAWLIMLTIGLAISLVDVGLAIGLDDHAVDIVTKTPAVAITWVVPTACLAFVGYGLATVIGKQLE